MYILIKKYFIAKKKGCHLSLQQVVIFLLVEGLKYCEMGSSSSLLSPESPAEPRGLLAGWIVPGTEVFGLRFGDFSGKYPEKHSGASVKST